MPRFYVESPENGPLTVYNTATGTVASTIRLPKGMAFTGQVAAVGDGRTFVAAFVTNTGSMPYCVTHLYEFRLSQSGQEAPPSRIVATVPGVRLGDLAVSADGRTIAYGTSPGIQLPSRPGRLRRECRGGRQCQHRPEPELDHPGERFP